jgi:hypothetical protein
LGMNETLLYRLHAEIGITRFMKLYHDYIDSCSSKIVISGGNWP